MYGSYLDVCSLVQSLIYIPRWTLSGWKLGYAGLAQFFHFSIDTFGGLSDLLALRVLIVWSYDLNYLVYM